MVLIPMSSDPKTLLGPDEEVSEVDGGGGGEGSSWCDRPDEMSCCGYKEEEWGKPFYKTFWFFS